MDLEHKVRADRAVVRVAGLVVARVAARRKPAGIQDAQRVRWGSYLVACAIPGGWSEGDWHDQDGDRCVPDQLGEEIQRAGHKAEIAIAGGAAMVLPVGNREATRDVEVYLSLFES